MTRYSRWTVIGPASAGANYNRRVRCVCDCGTEKVVYFASLEKGTSKSCGCLRDELAVERPVIHGSSRRGQRTAEYGVWVGMLSRCYDSKCTSYPSYGARGISVCDRWRFGEAGLSPFECFLADMGARPSPKHSIERVQNGGNYEPGNCRWATSIEQSRNTRRNRIVEVGGEQMCLAAAIERFAKVGYRTVTSRLHYGWTLEDALFKPADTTRSHRKARAKAEAEARP